MRGASEVPAIPEDVRKLAETIASKFGWGYFADQAKAAIEKAIMADRLTHPVDVAAEPVAWRIRLDEQDAWAYHETDMTTALGLFDYQIRPLFEHPPTRRDEEIRNASLEEAAKLADAQWDARVVPEARGQSELGKAIRALAARPVDTGREKALEEAINALLAHRVGDLPAQGWLRDNVASRKALSDLARALANPENGRG